MAEAEVRCCQSFGRPRTDLHLPPEMNPSIPPFLCFPIPPVFCAGRCPRLRCSLEHWGIRAERHQGRICTFSFSDPEESEVLRIVDVHVLGNIPVYTYVYIPVYTYGNNINWYHLQGLASKSSRK